jgi:hypothetical protein
MSFGAIYEEASSVMEPETSSLVNPAKYNQFIELYNSKGRSATTPRELTPFLKSAVSELGIRPKEILMLSDEAVKLGNLSDAQFGLIKDTLHVSESKIFEADPKEKEIDPKKKKDSEGDVVEPGVEGEDKPVEDGAVEEPKVGDGGEVDLGADVSGVVATSGDAPAGDDAPEEEKSTEVEVEHPEEQVFGHSSGEGFTLKRITGDDNNLEDLQIIDAAQNVLLSATKENLDPSDIRGFLLAAVDSLSIGDVDVSIIQDYDLFGVEAAKKAAAEEMAAGAEDTEIPGEVKLPDAETKPGDFGYGEEKFNPMGESKVKIKEGLPTGSNGRWRLGDKSEEQEHKDWMNSPDRKRMIDLYATGVADGKAGKEVQSKSPWYLDGYAEGSGKDRGSLGESKIVEGSNTINVDGKYVPFKHDGDVLLALAGKGRGIKQEWVKVEKTGKKNKYGDVIFKIVGDMKESKLNEDRQKVFDEAGVDEEDWFRGGDNRIYFRCPDPALAQTVAAQLGARVDGEVQFEGLMFVRAVLESKGSVNKGKLNEAEVTVDDVLKAFKEPEYEKFYQRMVDQLKRYKAQGELTAGRAKSVIRQFATPVVHMAYLSAQGVSESELPYENIIDAVVARLLDELNLGGEKNEGRIWEGIKEAVAKYKNKKVNEDAAVIASDIADKSVADSIASSKQGVVSQDPTDKTKWIVIAKDNKTTTTSGSGVSSGSASGGI